MRLLWFLAPILVILGGTVGMVKFAKRQPSLSGEEQVAIRQRRRRNLFVSDALLRLIALSIAGIALVVIGRWVLGVLALIAGVGYATWLWNRRNSSPS